jgi:hypothetical protein
VLAAAAAGAAKLTFLISCQAIFLYSEVSCNLHGIRSMPMKKRRKTRSMAAAKSSATKKAKRKTAKKKVAKKKKK